MKSLVRKPAASRVLIPLFTFFAILMLVATGPVAARGQEPNKEVSALWDQVLRQLASFYSIRANVRMNIALGGEEFIAQGEYIEKIYAPQPNELTKSKYRLHVTFPLSANPTTSDTLNELIVVCDLDRNRVWQYSSVEGVKRQDFVDISRVLEAVKRSKKPPLGVGTLSGMTALGGLGGMLRSLRDMYVFSEPPEETSLKGRTPLPVWKIKGTLTPRALTRLGCSPDEKKTYPAHIPVEVEIFFGKEDLFPYRIHYYNVTGSDSAKRTLLTQLVYCDVLFNDRNIPDYRFSTADMFDERAADTRNDITAEYIKRLGL